MCLALNEHVTRHFFLTTTLADQASFLKFRIIFLTADPWGKKKKKSAFVHWVFRYMRNKKHYIIPTQ